MFYLIFPVWNTPKVKSVNFIANLKMYLEGINILHIVKSSVRTSEVRSLTCIQFLGRASRAAVIQARPTTLLAWDTVHTDLDLSG